MKLMQKLNPDKKRDYEMLDTLAPAGTGSFSSVVRQLNRIYRDNDIDLMTRFEEISKMLFCKFIDDEVRRSPRRGESAFLIRSNESEDDVYHRISKLYQDHLPKSIDTRGGLLPRPKAVYEAARILGTVPLLQYGEDVKGTTYEEMIRNTFDGDENQQYFTPRQLVRFMIELVNPQMKEVVCDPACGTGGFIIECLKKIRESLKSEDSAKMDETLLRLSKRYLKGVEIDSRIAWVAKMNCFAHGGSPDCIHHLPRGGSLAYDNGSLELMPDESVDVIVTNPPFGSDFTDAKNLLHYRSGQGKKSVRRGVLFLERCLRALRPGGRMAIIVDDSILNSSSNQPIREVILEDAVILAVLSLPDEMFQPYASVKASVLLLKKKTSLKEKQTRVLMANLKRVGKKPNGSPEHVDEKSADGCYELFTDFPFIAQMWQHFQLGRALDSSDEPQCFVTRLDLNQTNPSRRLDTVFHDPSKYSAQTSLQNSLYPIYTLSAIFRLRNETIIPAKSHPDDEIPYLSLADIEKGTGRYSIQSVKGSRIKSSVRRFEAGDILFAKMRPQLRKAALVQENGFCSSECLVLKTRFRTMDGDQQTTLEEPIEGEADEFRINPEFMSILLRSRLVYGQVMHHLTGIGRPRVPAREVMKVKIPIPPIEKQNALVSQFKSEEDESMALKSQAERMLKTAWGLIRAAHDEVVDSLGVDRHSQ